MAQPVQDMVNTTCGDGLCCSINTFRKSHHLLNHLEYRVKGPLIPQPRKEGSSSFRFNGVQFGKLCLFKRIMNIINMEKDFPFNNTILK